MAAAQNLLVLISDEHASCYLGCYGHPVVRTPNLDRLAAQGTRFTNAYTNCPICVPARASFATGRHVHELGTWDNAFPFTGQAPTWADRLHEHGRPAVSIGKLHYRDDRILGGFDRTLIPMHIKNGVGDVFGSIREPMPVRIKTRTLSEKIGPGESSYTRYDRAITTAAEQWLTEEAPRLEEPWTLYVGLVAPHFPLIAPEEFYALYPPEQMELPRDCRPAAWQPHPWLDAMRGYYVWDQFFDDDKRRIATASYFGLCSFLDHNIGRILGALEKSGAAGRTRILYSSDHGDNLGVRGLWGKSNAYEESSAVPMILVGDGVPDGRVVTTPVSLVDLFPTVLDATDTPADPADAGLPGRSLLRIATEPDDPDRTVFSEYHAGGAVSGMFMLRRGRWKYVHYVGMRPQLFDLDADPLERTDLAGRPEHAAVLAGFETELRGICDPEAIDARAKADQAALVERHGGMAAILARGSQSGGTPPPAQFVDAA